jgi:nucleotide-binding universal stress UspA family protein
MVPSGRREGMRATDRLRRGSSLFKRILVPVDFSAHNKGALRAARQMASQSAGSVTLLHVIETIERLSFRSLRRFYGKLETRARKKLAATSLRLANEGVKVRTKLLYGHRVQKIVAEAARHDIDLIILSSHKVDLRAPGRGWSTVSYKVALLSPCPVMLVK